MTGNTQDRPGNRVYLWHDYMRHCDSLGDEKEEETVGIYIDSVVTCRHITSNSSASTPLNTKKIAVKKVSDIDVGMIGPELECSMYKCCCFGVFLRETAAAKSRTNLSTHSGKATNGWTDWHQMWHTRADSSGIRYAKQIAPRDTRGHTGGLRGSKMQHSGETVKRLDRLAPTLWFTSADSSGTGHRLNTAGPIGTQFGTRL